MPTYEYACKACAEHLEVVQSFKDDALTECPNCGGELRKVFGAIGIAFKGSGFYRNDSRPEPKESKGASKKDADGGGPKETADSKSASSGSSGSSGDASSTKSAEQSAKSDTKSAASS
ncbi:MAG: FmdB family transcriptional regulator [Actinomycetota bacterium]|nr:FmdB family transcriptional regulator [Actinomycetota bacterium]